MTAKTQKSKKPSAANSRLPEPLIFFIDRALGNQIIANALRNAGEKVIVHSDYFAPDALDITWLTHAGKQNWVVLTKDSKIHYRTLEREALLNAKVRAFIFVAGNLPASETAVIFVTALPAMKRFMENHAPPFIAKVFRDSRVALWATDKI